MFRRKYIKFGVIAIVVIAALWLVILLIAKAGDKKDGDGVFRIQTSSYPMYILTLNITSRSK